MKVHTSLSELLLEEERNNLIENGDFAERLIITGDKIYFHRTGFG